MVTFKKLALAAGVSLALGSGVTQAADVNSTLFSGQQLGSDSSAELLINAGGTVAAPGSNRKVDIGDRLLGIIEIEKLTQGVNTRALGIGSSNNELTGIFDILVTGKTINSTQTSGTYLGVPCSVITPCVTSASWTFGAVPIADFNADTGTNPVLNPAGILAAFFDDPANNFLRNTTVAGGISSVTGGTRFWNFGLGTNGFWSATALTDDIGLLGSLPTGVNGGTFNLGINQLPGGIGRQLLLVPCLAGPVNGCGNGSLTSKDASSSFDSFDQSQININVVPEPTTLALLGSALIGFGAMRRRKS